MLSPQISNVPADTPAWPAQREPWEGAGDMAVHNEPPASRPGPGWRVVYIAVLTWAFTLFNSVRMLAYLPTVWAIHTSGDSSQHSLWTWLTWLGANLTMAAWLYEQNGQRFSRAVVVNAGNACMCLVTVAVIVFHRL